jgi:hypothetical protein
VSLDQDSSSDPNPKAVHAGASMRKAQHLQPKSDIADAGVYGLFCLFQTRCPHSSTLRVGGKAHFARKTIILFYLKAFDAVPREMLFKVLAPLGFPPKIANVVRLFHENVTLRSGSR